MTIAGIIPDTTRRVLLANAREALGELLRDESIDTVTYGKIELAHSLAVNAFDALTRTEEIYANL